jgi:hypothetical protein
MKSVGEFLLRAPAQIIVLVFVTGLMVLFFTGASCLSN